MKKAVLVIDHKDRDLRGVVLIAFWLNKKYKILPYLTHTKNEISCLIKHKPELILIQHIRHKHQQPFLEYAHHQKTCVAVGLAEGLPDHLDNLFWYIGRDEYMHYIDVFLPWGPRLWELAKKKELLQHASVEVVGSPRFDYHTSRYSELCIPKNVFCDTLGIDASKPTILWMTSFKHCPFGGDLEEFVKKYQNPNFSDHRRAPTVREFAISSEKTFNLTSDYFLKLIQEFSDLNFIIKLHPVEPLAVYQEKFGNFSNVTVIKSLDKFSLSDMIRHADIQITWRCSTSLEAWMMDIQKKVITVENPEVEFEMLKYLSIGNDIVSDYSSLKRKIVYYLEGAEVSQELIDRRHQFFHDYLYSNDGNSAERCADALYAHLSAAKPKMKLYNYKIFLKNLWHYRFNKNWLSSKRHATHPKYINPDDIHTEMKRLMDLYGHQVEYEIDM